MLKKIIFAVTALIVASTSLVSAQNAGEWKVGGKLNIYSNWDGAIGIGAYGRYGLNSDFRLEPSFVILCKQGMSVDISADVQYPIQLSPEFELYPLAGLSLNDPGKFGLGVNLGTGLGYKLTNKVSIDFGLKWVIQTQDFTPNPLIFSFGSGYKF